jgi:hypothetical protein
VSYAADLPPPVICPPDKCDSNVNSNSNSNSNANCNTNTNWNSSHTSVDVCVNVDVSAQVCAPSAPDIDLSCLNICDNKGIVNLMPEDNYQVINAGGESCDPSALANNVIFHLDQVNNLVNNGHVENLTNTSGSISTLGPTQGGAVSGGTASSVTGSDISQSLDHAGSASVDGITQSITLGANILNNNSVFTGHDSVVADHNSHASHDGAVS